MITALIVVGLILAGLGGLGTWFAMNSPLQLQPLNGIAVLLGGVLILLGMGGKLFG